MTANKTIRLFVDAHVFDGEYQGSRSFIKELYTGLAAYPRLQLFMAAYDTVNLQKQFPHSSNITFIKYRSKSSVRRLLFQVPALIKKHRIDYAHFQYITPLFRYCRYIVTTHDVLFKDCPQYFSYWYRVQKKLLYQYAAKRAAILTTVSAFSKQSITRYLGVAAPKVHVIPHGVAPHYFEPYNKEEEQQYISRNYGIQNFILYVSRFEPRKNHALLLQAFTELGLYKKGYSLVFAGHHSLNVPAFETQYAALPEAAKKAVFIFSKIDDEALLHFYRAAAGFVYPSAAEGFGMPPLEAAAAATPVLCSNSTALADFDFFGNNHITVTDHTAFKERLAALLDHKNEKMETGSIQKHVQQHYNWQSTAAAFYKLITENFDDDKF